MNASNIFTLPNEISSGRKEISHDVKETLSLLKQFYDVPIVKYIDFREVYSEHIITNDDANIIEELLKYQQLHFRLLLKIYL